MVPGSWPVLAWGGVWVKGPARFWRKAEIIDMPQLQAFNPGPSDHGAIVCAKLWRWYAEAQALA